MASVINSKSVKHPNTFSLIKGETLLSKEVEAINESISLILRTAKGELWGDPTFGSTLYQFMHEPTGEMMTSQIQYVVKQDLNEQETRMFITDESDISVEYEGSTVKVNIRYNLRYTDYRTEYQYITKIVEE